MDGAVAGGGVADDGGICNQEWAVRMAIEAGAGPGSSPEQGCRIFVEPLCLAAAPPPPKG